MSAHARLVVLLSDRGGVFDFRLTSFALFFVLLAPLDRIAPSFLCRTQVMPHVYQVVGNYSESYPPLHSILALVTAAVQPASPLENADPSFAANSPPQALRVPTFFTLLLSFPASSARYSQLLYSGFSCRFHVGVLWNPPSAATSCGTDPNICLCDSMEGINSS